MIASLATTALTQFLDIGGIRFAYRRFGTPAGTPLVFTQHFMGNLDNFDPAVSDALAAGREVILFDNAASAAAPAPPCTPLRAWPPTPPIRTLDHAGWMTAGGWTMASNSKAARSAR